MQRYQPSLRALCFPPNRSFNEAKQDPSRLEKTSGRNILVIATHAYIMMSRTPNGSLFALLWNSNSVELTALEPDRRLNTTTKPRSTQNNLDEVMKMELMVTRALVRCQ